MIVCLWRCSTAHLTLNDIVSSGDYSENWVIDATVWVLSDETSVNLPF